MMGTSVPSAVVVSTMAMAMLPMSLPGDVGESATTARARAKVMIHTIRPRLP